MAFIESVLETQEFATLPPVATKVLELLDDENVDVRDLAKIIESDAPLTLKLLRVANSPLYATRTDVDSVNQAIMTLGFNRLVNIVLGVSIFSRFLMSSQKKAVNLLKKFWWHSSSTAVVAKSLVRKIKVNYKEAEFIGGLLHDIGKLAMIQFDSDKFLKVVEMVEEKNVMDVEAEKEIFGVDHLEVGKEIAKMWKLPKQLEAVIASHNFPEKIGKHADLVAAVRFSDILCEMWGADIHEGFEKVKIKEEESLQVLFEHFPTLRSLDLEVFTFELEEDFKMSTQFLNLISEA